MFLFKTKRIFPIPLQKSFAMTTALAKQLSTRMKAKNLSASMLEREAGLKAHAVLNILRGKSKRPSAHILQAIADTLGCTIPDLLGHQEIFQVDESTQSKNELLNSPYDNPNLLQDVLQTVNEKIKKENLHLTVQQTLTCIEEIYLHSLQKKQQTIDPLFADWFLNLLGG